jgi:hypothetical protein
MSADLRPALVLAGRLEAIPLADVLQLVAAGRRDGVLRVEDEATGALGEIVLRGGKVVDARVSSAGEPLGAILVRRCAVSPDRVGEALRRQSAAAPWKPLGQLLLEMGELEPGTLQCGLAEQLARHTATILGFARGVFRFHLDPGPLRAEARRGVPVAIEPHALVLEAARLADESRLAASVH